MISTSSLRRHLLSIILSVLSLLLDQNPSRTVSLFSSMETHRGCSLPLSSSPRSDRSRQVSSQCERTCPFSSDLLYSFFPPQLQFSPQASVNSFSHLYQPCLWADTRPILFINDSITRRPVPIPCFRFRIRVGWFRNNAADSNCNGWIFRTMVDSLRRILMV